MLIGKNLVKTFFSKNLGRDVNKVNGVSIKVSKNEIVGLLGVNGSGKTTTIKMLSHRINPTSGTITVDESPINDNVYKKISVISGGEKGVYPQLTGRQNLEYYGSLYGINRKNVKKHIETIGSIVGIEDFVDQRVEEFSKGMIQRLQIAKGLLTNPEYIFLDEPTLGLDIVIAKEIRKYIKEISKRNVGILLTTHYIKEAEALCDYIYVINNGEIILEGRTEDIKEKFRSNEILEVKISSFNDYFLAGLEIKVGNSIVDIDKELNTVILYNSNDALSSLVEVAKENEIQVLSFLIREVSLEDILEDVIKKEKR
ncbi:ABC transporter ATP-binding protein [Enterococcus faecalis]|uniref:ABC transporter ATP-binding protein n=1 Tax=Enterococcus faecalis TaxID=1351 RepID=UPI001A1CDDB8|nr:ABC transporter ATP-binding protein [Enterococcus faecalis]EGQ7428151.1 ABC transporter ATP-binding protein [Enterococcus faecalis]